MHVDIRSVTKALGTIYPTTSCGIASHLKVCGCVAYHHLPKSKQGNKLEMRANPAIFLGMAGSSLCYRLLDLETGIIIQRRSVRFREDMAVGANYVEKLLAKRYYDKQIIVPSDIPYVILPLFMLQPQITNRRMMPLKTRALRRTIKLMMVWI